MDPGGWYNPNGGHCQNRPRPKTAHLSQRTTDKRPAGRKDLEAGRQASDLCVVQYGLLSRKDGRRKLFRSISYAVSTMLLTCANSAPVIKTVDGHSPIPSRVPGPRLGPPMSWFSVINPPDKLTQKVMKVLGLICRYVMENPQGGSGS